MKKIMGAVALMSVVVSVVPSTAIAALMPVGISASYSSDSDGVSCTNYSIGTQKEDNPWNYTYSHLRIRQRDSQGDFVDENAFTVKWHRPINDEAGVSAWVGYTDNNIWNFIPFGVMYNGTVNYTDQVALIYSHESVATVPAYNDHILANRLSLRHQQEISKRLTLDTNISYASYSDDNFRKTLGLTLKKDFGMYFRLGLAYRYDTSDVNKHSVFYIPKGESSLSIAPEVALPVGEGTLVMTASKSLASHDINGELHSMTYGVRYHLDNLYIGTQYSHSDSYWSRDTSFSWTNRW